MYTDDQIWTIDILSMASLCHVRLSLQALHEHMILWGLAFEFECVALNHPSPHPEIPRCIHAQIDTGTLINPNSLSLNYLSFVLGRYQKEKEVLLCKINYQS